MGETAEYQRLQETSEPDYQHSPSDDEEVDLDSSLLLLSVSHLALDKRTRQMKPRFQQVSLNGKRLFVNYFVVLCVYELTDINFKSFCNCLFQHLS